ncbi:hypothetical protein M405DRAFT_862345 [Rhizopogon salebrosus TDB-379]|nr:hypothetical protein M405DRAFT_862345 [Rhizopogon salebrosus TDB-379]
MTGVGKADEFTGMYGGPNSPTIPTSLPCYAQTRSLLPEHVLSVVPSNTLPSPKCTPSPKIGAKSKTTNDGEQPEERDKEWIGMLEGEVRLLKEEFLLSSPVAAVHHRPLKPKLKSQWQATCPVACEVLEKACIANPQSEQSWLAAVKLKAESSHWSSCVPTSTPTVS